MMRLKKAPGKEFDLAKVLNPVIVQERGIRSSHKLRSFLTEDS